jgi:predicted dehydrogenase
MDSPPMQTICWRSFHNAPAPHRDTHVHLLLRFSDDRSATASISKTVHGASNNLEFTVIGTSGSATWRFLQPDEVEFGSGIRTTVLRRQTTNDSSASSPFHGLGWLEGYIEITRQSLRAVSGLDSVPVPTLQESLAGMRILLKSL